MRHLLAALLAAGLAAASASTPTSAQTLVGDGSVACGKSYAVAPGDTLSRVAARAYGDALLYRVLLDANREALNGDAEHLAIGMAITVPCIDAAGNLLTAEEAAKAAASMEAVVRAEGPLSPDALDTLFGPVALFPDPVLTPVLVATTFPLDVVKAGRFVAGAEDLSDKDRAARAAGQSWDDSVRELAAGFPDLLTRMSDNIDWTEQAGEAVVAQTDDVLASIQRLRQKARDNGYLIDNRAQKIEEVNDKIVIAPADPNVVYVPSYDSEVVYTTPVTGPPVYHYGYGYDYVYHDDDDWDDALIAGGIILGGAVILDEIFDDDDWHGWDGDDDIDWDGGDITIDRGDINIDRDEINIGGGQIGDGERPRIGDGDRVSIGDSDRTQIDRGDLAARRNGEGGSAGGLPPNRQSISTPASREAAREKIQTRKSSGAAPADLRATRPVTVSRDPARARTAGPSQNISKPKANRAPTARTPSRSTTFTQPSRPRPSVSSSRGRASVGRSGGGRGGGGGRRR